MSSSSFVQNKTQDKVKQTSWRDVTLRIPNKMNQEKKIMMMMMMTIVPQRDQFYCRCHPRLPEKYWIVSWLIVCDNDALKSVSLKNSSTDLPEEEEVEDLWWLEDDSGTRCVLIEWRSLFHIEEKDLNWIAIGE